MKRIRKYIGVLLCLIVFAAMAMGSGSETNVDNSNASGASDKTGTGSDNVVMVGGSFEKDGCTYQIWIEDSQSIAAKVQLVQKYNLAGVAAWKLGFENSGIWQVITDNLSGSTAE